MDKGNNYNYILSEDDKYNILEMFWGPYKEEWKDNKGVVDNRDSTIAKRLGLPRNIVEAFISNNVKTHFEKATQNKLLEPTIPKQIYITKESLFQ